MQPVMPGGIPYVFNQETGEVHAIFEKYGGGRFFGWHPDGQQFLYWADVEQVGLQLVNAATLETRKLATPNGPLQGAEISPDGKSVVYIDVDSTKSEQPTKAIWLVSVEGGSSKPIINVGPIAYLQALAWSPDSKRLIYKGECEPTPKQGEAITVGSFCILDVDALKAQRIANPNVGDDPKWSPDGRSIVSTGLASDEKLCEIKRPTLSVEEQLTDPCRFTGFSIFLVDPSTSETKELTHGVKPAWSPDGKSIAFLSNRTGASEVWMVDAATGDTRQVTTDGQAKDSNNLIWFYEVTK